MEDEKLILGMSKKEFTARIIFYTVIILILSAVMFLLYAVVYERCYNIMNADDITVFRLYKADGKLYAVFFNNVYELLNLCRAYL